MKPERKVFWTVFTVVFISLSFLLFSKRAHAEEDESKKWNILGGVDVYRLFVNLGQNGEQKEIVPVDYNGLGLNLLFLRKNGEGRPSWGIQGDYLQNGHKSEKVTCSSGTCSSTQTDWKFQILSVSGVLFVPLGGSWYGTGSLGVGRVSYTFHGSGAENLTEEGKGYALPLGVALEWMPQKSSWSLHLKHTRFTIRNTHDRDVHAWSAGFRYALK